MAAVGHSPSQPKLRSSCTGCHDAKVKCSGERQGCARCRKAQLTCIYLVSRAGKVTGKRTRRKAGASADAKSAAEKARVTDNQHNISLTLPWQPGQSMLPTSPTEQLPFIPSGLSPADSLMSLPSTMLDLDTFTAMDAMLASTGPMSLDEQSSSASPGSAIFDRMNTPATTTSYSTMSLSNDAPAMTDLWDLHCSDLVSTPQSGDFDMKSGALFNDSTVAMCGRDLAQIVTTLEDKLSQNVLPLDVILCTSRHSINRLKVINNLQLDNPSPRCAHLLGAAIHQVIDLYACALPVTYATGNGTHLHKRDDGRDQCLPVIGIGGFYLEADDQGKILATILQKELDRALSLVEALHKDVPGCEILRSRLETMVKDIMHGGFTDDCADSQ